jgi:integrase
VATHLKPDEKSRCDIDPRWTACFAPCVRIAATSKRRVDVGYSRFSRASQYQMHSVVCPLRHAASSQDSRLQFARRYVKLSECVELYIKMKHENGHPYSNSGSRLRAFARGIGDVHLGEVSVSDVLRFTEVFGTSPLTRQFKDGLIRNFFLYCKGRYPMGNNPMPPKCPRPPESAYVPRIYSRDEIRALLRAIEPAQSGMGCVIPVRTYRTFLLFVYATGVSLGEAHQMLLKDVDLKRKRITIRSRLFGKVRTVPIGSDLCRVLTSYIGFRSKHKSPKPEQLFIDVSGKALRWRTIQTTFCRVRKIANLSSESRTLPLRMQDLRDAFVVHRLNTWSKRGLDLRSMVPPLAPTWVLSGLPQQNVICV